MPPELEITAPPAAVRIERAALANAVDAVVPAKRPDRNLLIGTWNLRAFGGLTKCWQSENRVLERQPPPVNGRKRLSTMVRAVHAGGHSRLTRRSFRCRIVSLRESAASSSRNSRGGQG